EGLARAGIEVESVEEVEAALGIVDRRVEEERIPDERARDGLSSSVEEERFGEVLVVVLLDHLGLGARRGGQFSRAVLEEVAILGRTIAIEIAPGGDGL